MSVMLSAPQPSPEVSSLRPPTAVRPSNEAEKSTAALEVRFQQNKGEVVGSPTSTSEIADYTSTATKSGDSHINYYNHHHLGPFLPPYPPLELRGGSATAFYVGKSETIAETEADGEKLPLLRLSDVGYWSDYYGRLDDGKKGAVSNSLSSMSPQHGGDLYSPLPYPPLPPHPEAVYGHHAAANYHHSNHHNSLGKGGYSSNSYSSQYPECGAFNLNINVNLNIHPSGLFTNIISTLC